MGCIMKWVNVGEWGPGFSPFKREDRGEPGWDGGAIRMTGVATDYTRRHQ